MIEHKIGEVFESDGKNVRVEQAIGNIYSCGKCEFNPNECPSLQYDCKLDDCIAELRDDGKDVVFVKVE